MGTVIELLFGRLGRLQAFPLPYLNKGFPVSAVTKDAHFVMSGAEEAEVTTQSGAEPGVDARVQRSGPRESELVL